MASSDDDMSSVAAGSTSQIGQQRCEASAAAGRAGGEADGLRPVVAAVGEAQRACRVRAECERGKKESPPREPLRRGLCGFSYERRDTSYLK